MTKLVLVKASDIKIGDDLINEYSPMYVPLSSDYISRNYNANIGTKKFDIAIRNFITMISLYAEPLKEIDISQADIEYAKWIVDVITDLNHVCVKYGHILQKAGCGDMLWEVLRKTNDK